MPHRTWFITGVSRGFGRELTRQLLERGDRVVGTVRDTGKVADLREQYPETFRIEVLDMTDTEAIRAVIERSFAQLGRICLLPHQQSVLSASSSSTLRAAVIACAGASDRPSAISAWSVASPRLARKRPSIWA